MRRVESEERLWGLLTLACILLSAGCERGKFCEMGLGLVTLECRGTEWYIVRINPYNPDWILRDCSSNCTLAAKRECLEGVVIFHNTISPRYQLNIGIFGLP